MPGARMRISPISPRGSGAPPSGLVDAFEFGGELELGAVSHVGIGTGTVLLEGYDTLADGVVVDRSSHVWAPSKDVDVSRPEFMPCSCDQNPAPGVHEPKPMPVQKEHPFLL